jgi:periplasmic protein TonB
MTTKASDGARRAVLATLALQTLALQTIAFPARAEPVPARPAEAPSFAARAMVDPKERAAWARSASDRILSHTRHPHRRETDPTPRRVMLRFKVDGAGQVSEPGVEAGSGDPALDDAAVSGLRAASPLPKPPWLMLDSAGTADLRLAVNFVGSRRPKPAERR